VRRAWPALTAVLLLGGCAWTGHPFSREPLAEHRRLLEEGKYVELVGRLDNDAISGLPGRVHAEAYALLSLGYRRSGDLARALDTAQLAEGRFPKDLRILTCMADLLQDVGLDGRARPYYERILAIHPNNAAGNLGAARIYRRQGHLSKAQLHYERVLSQKGWDRTAAIWRDYAEVLADRREYEGAERALARALALREDMETLLAQARVLRRRGMKTRAYEELDKAAGMAVDERGLRLQKALWLLEDGRDPEADILSSAILSEDPSSALAYWVRASVRMRAGETAAAVRDLEAAARGSGGFIAEVAKLQLGYLEKRR